MSSPPTRSRRSLGVGLLVLVALLVGTQWAGATRNEPQQVVPVWGPNVRANADTSNWSQHEPHLAISRTNPDVVVAVAKDYRTSNVKEVWIYVSHDGGQTWPADWQLQVPGLPTDINEQSDPVVMARDDGRFYVVCLGKGTSSGSHGLFITWSDDDGLTWADAVSITYNETPGSLDDKEWLAIDNNPASPYYHNMYVGWSDPYGLGILFSRSTDEGQTWTPYVDLLSSDFTEYAYPVVAADGDLYYFYMDGWGYGADGWIRYLHSADGGQTFTGPYPVVATSQPYSPIHGYGGYDEWRFFSIITAAADPNDSDQLWVAWTDDNGVDYGKTDVLWVGTSDGGATWTSPERLSHDDPNAYVDHITPVFAIGADSRLHAFWLDRREDPDNILFHGWHTSTGDGGLTWEPDSRVSEEAFDLNLYFPPPSGYNAAGDYWGLDTVGNIVMAAWNTTVETSQDIYVSRGVFTSTIVTLTGQVRDGVTLAPIDWAMVTAEPGPTVPVNPSGIYTMTLAPGVYTVTASANGYYSLTVGGVELISDTVVVDFDLAPLPLPVTLTGQVSDSVSLLPIEGATVTAGLSSTTTGATGFYTMTLSPGTYTVTASASGYLSQTVGGLELISGTVVQNFALAPVPCPTPTIQSVLTLTNGLTVTFSAQVTATPPISYLWSFGDGITSSLPTPTHTYAAYGLYTVTLTVQDACGMDTWRGHILLPEPLRYIYLPCVRKEWP